VARDAQATYQAARSRQRGPSRTLASCRCARHSRGPQQRALGFLKTIIPSRKATRDFIAQESDDV
jgi:hypothetical protein